MAVDSITSQVPFVLTLSTPAEVNAAGEVQLTPENLAPEGSGAVQSVFGRTGEVVAEAGDYTVDDVTDALRTDLTNAAALTLGDYADDTAASAGGVQPGQLYRTGSIIKVNMLI